MLLTPDQFYASFLTVLVATLVASLMILHRERPRVTTRLFGTLVLGSCAALAIASWLRFGAVHSVFVDEPGVREGAPRRAKVERHQPFHFHEFFHYYLGSKYFRDLGYEGLYDCTALADEENASALGVRKHVGDWIRDLDDVLRDRPYSAAIERCRTEYVPKMSPSRWEAFRADLRELQRIVPDEWWADATFDAGFNPPPSFVLLGSTLANIIPIRLFGLPTYLVATTLDMALLVACWVVLRRTFGPAVVAMATIFFGASLIASYVWNGGGFLRYTWISAVVFGLAAAKRGRWALAGAFLGMAACDRVFPAGFAMGAAVPLAWRALVKHSPVDRERLARFGIGFGGAVAILVVLSALVFGFDAWRVFATRIGRHGDVYYVMHIGLKKVMTWRDWVPSQNFVGHEGLQRFHDWNLHLRSTWASMWWLTVPTQLITLAGACAASLRRRPYESSLMVGTVAMFFFSLPANYYYAVLALVPAMLLRAALTAPTVERRLREWCALCGFTIFWLTTLLAPHMYGDGLVYNHVICVALFVFFEAWIVLWLPWQPILSAVRARWGVRAQTPALASGSTTEASPP
jgi:hypothetical protein